MPRVKTEPSAAWVAEIPVFDATLDELESTPSKLAGLMIITRELADDSSPETASTVGEGLARDCARKIYAAFFSAQAAPAPAGLASLTGASGVFTMAAGANWSNVDALAKFKQATGSNVSLLQPDATAAGRSLIAGVPLLTSTAVPAGIVSGLDRTSAYLVIRDDVEIEADASAFFTSDRVAIRAWMRAGFGFPDPKAIVKTTKTA